MADEGRTANESFLDGLLRHQIGLLRLAGSLRRRTVEILDATEEELAARIRRRLAAHSGLKTPASVRAMQALVRQLRRVRGAAWAQVAELWREEMTELALAEPRMAAGALQAALPVALVPALPPSDLLRRVVATRPFAGRTLREWARSIEAADLRRIEDQVKIGVIQGEDSATIARRVVGRARLRGRDGVTEITRRDAAAITRTAVNAIANEVRRELFVANAAVLTEELYVATLDARTTPVCRALDGQRFPVGEGPIPPRHIGCRSLRVALIDGEAIGRRPAREFTERQLLREYAAEAGVPTVARRAELPRGHKGRFDAFRRDRIRELTGQVPAKVTYQQWLARQSARFQDDVLGTTRGRLFRAGGLTLGRFVNRRGDEIPLAELARREREAFEAAGLDPATF